MDVPQPETPEHREHENPDPGTEIATVDGDQELENPDAEEHRPGRLAGGRASIPPRGTEPSGEPRLQGKEERRAEDQPRHEATEPGRGQSENEHGADDGPADARRQEPTRPAWLSMTLGTGRPRRGQGAWPEADGARGVGDDEPGRPVGEERRHDREGEDRAPTGDRIDPCGDERRAGEKHHMLERHGARQQAQPRYVSSQRPHHFAPRPRSPLAAAGSRLGTAAGAGARPATFAASAGTLVPPSTSM